MPNLIIDDVLDMPLEELEKMERDRLLLRQFADQDRRLDLDPRFDLGPPPVNLMPLPLNLNPIPGFLEKGGEPDKTEYMRWLCPKWPVTNHRLVGIELEMEFFSDGFLLRRPKEEWTLENDNSLRGSSIELISDPLRVEDVESSLNRLFNCLVEDSQKTMSRRTSTHVHLGQRHKTLKYSVDLSLLLLWYSEAFFLASKRIIDHSRVDNLFCASFQSKVVDVLTEFEDKAYEVLVARESASVVPSTGVTLFECLSERHKYSFVNPAPIFRLGTIEVRVMPNAFLMALSRADGVTPQAAVSEWVRQLDHINNLNSHMVTPSESGFMTIDEIFRQIRSMSVEDLLEQMFPIYRKFLEKLGPSKLSQIKRQQDLTFLPLLRKYVEINKKGLRA